MFDIMKGMEVDMTQAQIIKRIEALERQLTDVRQQIETKEKRELAGTFKDSFGMFRNDPYFKRAMEAGAEYRRSLRPGKPKKRAKKK